MNSPPSTSKIVTWAGYFSLMALLALPLGVLIVRSGAWQPGLGLFALGCAVAVLLLALFIILALLPGFRPWRADIFKRSILLLPGCIVFLSGLTSSGDYPPIHDISTDTADPPTFSAAAARRGEDANPLSIKPESIAAQSRSYPDIQTLHNDNSAAESFDRALATATAMGWEVYHSDRDNGRIEAVDTTAIMAFKDDVVIRLRSDGTGTGIDLRSVSRVGVGDMGANAKRIAQFQQRFEQ